MKILPNPFKSENISGTFGVDGNTKIYCDSRFEAQARRFAQLVRDCCGFELQFTDVIPDASVIFNCDESFSDERYVIMISQGVATVTCATQAGCFYAVETLRQVFRLDTPQQTLECANCYVDDMPRFAYRGLMIDLSKHFFGLDVLKQVVDVMSQVKLNKLHLRLSDDQGFRVQIDKYPLLTTVGSVRHGTEVVRNGKRYVDDCDYGGFLTKQQVAELVSYASERNVDIVPELEIPGHFAAALAAYPQFSCTGQVTEVRKSWDESKDILCAGNSASYSFISDILDELCDMFPSSIFHLGGSDVPKDRWSNCKLCRERMSELKLGNVDELQNYLLEYFRAYLAGKGRTAVCWDDGIRRGTSEGIVSQVWRPLSIKRCKKAVRRGRKVILSPYFYMYFGLPYALTPLGKTLRFNPLRGLRRSLQDSVLGVEGTVRTEYIADSDKLFFYLLPRLDALAECAWGYRKNNFAKRLKKRFALYDKMGLTYNSKATARQGRRLSTVKKFYKRDCDVEYNKFKQSDN